ncbi:hypothetical protein E4T43_01094 [Aureobasidium subglaciale]|nr:hypothetical protein E4T43_01094 [Aureobasidium subglaciale]
MRSDCLPCTCQCPCSTKALYFSQPNDRSEVPAINMAPKKVAVVRTAASSRPRRTAKPTTAATTTSATAAMPKKAAYKKAAPKKAAPKVTKKKATSKKTVASKRTYTKKDPEDYEPLPTITPREKARMTKNLAKNASQWNQKPEPYVAPTPEEEWIWKNIESKYTPAVCNKLEIEWAEKLNTNPKDRYIGNLDRYILEHQELDAEAWIRAHEKKIGAIEGQYTLDQITAMDKEVYAKQRRGKLPHIRDRTDMLYWAEIDKERVKILEERRKAGESTIVSAAVPPVQKLQKAIANSSPVKKAQGAFGEG